MSRKCLRCGDDEFRINGYCSCECESLHERELIIKEFHDIFARMEKLKMIDIRDRHDEEMMDRINKALSDSKWAADYCK